jgi:predicted nucleic acid-binding protein
MGKTRTRAAAAATGITLDTGALIALDRGDKRMIAMLARALAQRRRFRVPAGVVGQSWRDGHVQVTLARFLRSDEVTVVPLDEELARACGELCRAMDASDVIDASVVIVARQYGDSIITSDAEDLRRLAPRSAIISI